MSKNIDYDIIVIGAGCGGLSAAVCAVKQGYKVLLLERHNSVGGVTSSFVRGRFEFDTSLNQLCGFGEGAELGDIAKIANETGINKKIKWISIPSAFRLITKTRSGEKIDVTMPYGIDNYIAAMEKYIPGSTQSMKKLFLLCEECYHALDKLGNLGSEQNRSAIRDFLKNNGNFVRTSPYSVNEVLNALDVPQKARDIFEAYWLHFGIDCDRMSFIHYISTVYPLLRDGAVIPAQRSQALSLALASEFEDNGGELRLNSHASRIKFKNNKPYSVVLKNGTELKAGHIICNCSPSTVYSKMMKASDVPISAVKRTNARSFGARAACVYLGLNRAAKDLGINDYTTFITDFSDSVEQFEAMKAINTNNALTAVCLNAANPDASAENTTILQLTTFFTENCWANISPEEYFNEKDMFAARMISAYEKATGIQIYNYIEEIEISTPVSFAEYTGAPQGVTHGYFGSDWDSLLPRFMTEETDNDIYGLRFCGGWCTQLSGVHNAIATGRNTAYATISDITEERGVINEQ